ncbi:AMP-binding protein [Hymenobacter arizonensis]|uniref:O-succinylbenzoic acid--CoA ligase n=1 Tax=Hymenobacter arizonensis TaxID=1227077 RepID=A0A1I5SLD4_HYMAR|nr:AMP-binding protein [Hymenobacter arizonensis]SFP71146.1 O-succinylbenzoic acid--CoA ligase [Hymenobacter arizonensis]
MPASLPTSLLLNGREFAYAAIRKYPAQLDVPVNGYEAKVLDFVRQWLTGTQEFTLTTSGSTGTPQPIVLKRRQLEASAARTGDFFDLGPGDRALVCLNCEYIGGLMMLVRGLERNMHLTIVEPQGNPFDMVATDAEFDFAAFVPLQLRTMLAAGQAPRLNQIRALLVGGATVDSTLAKEIQALRVPVYHTYGMTETVSHIALRRLNGPEATSSYRVLTGIAAGLDERGCLTLRGDVTDDQLVVTNDQVNLLDAHTFEWLGRADFVINSGGVKVQAEKVELVLDVALAELGESRRCFVAGQPDERLGEQVTAFVEGEPLDTKAEKQLQTLLAERLEKYERPRQLVYVMAFEATANGKLDQASTLRKASK